MRPMLRASMLLGALFSCAAVPVPLGVPVLPEDDTAKMGEALDASTVIGLTAEMETLLSTFVETTINELRAAPCAANETRPGEFRVCDCDASDPAPKCAHHMPRTTHAVPLRQNATCHLA